MNFNYLPRRGGDKRSGSMVHGQVFFKRKGGGAGVGIEEKRGVERSGMEVETKRGVETKKFKR